MSEFETSEAWINELKRLCGVPLTDIGVEWQGQSFCFVPIADATPESLSIYVWIGPKSAAVSLDALLQLMWLQLQTVGPVTPVLGFEPDSGQLVIAQCIEYQDFRPSQALVLMGFLADLAAEARDVLAGKKKSSHAGESARRNVSLGMGAGLRRELPRGCLVQPRGV
jgi:hypothetical protein